MARLLNNYNLKTYGIRLMSDVNGKHHKHIIYIESSEKGLTYEALDLNEEIIKDSFPWSKLKKFSREATLIVDAQELYVDKLLELISKKYQLDLTLPEEAERALKGFIRNVENEEPIPKNLLNFIAMGVKKQYAFGDITSWTGKERGRPTVPDCDYLNMLAWYKFHLDPLFCNLPKTSKTGRLFKIAEHFQFSCRHLESDSPEHRAQALSYKAHGLRDLFSEKSVWRAIKVFEENGLENTVIHSTHNERVLLTFCSIILRLPHKDADLYPSAEDVLDDPNLLTHSQKIFYHWKKSATKKGQK